tara:strand:- start:1937 stop:2743 length:807 start_codon:yes stop_codon:yes gene_type:complete
MIIHEVKPVSVDFASYQADPAYSASDLKKLLSQCPKALWHSKHNELAPPKLPTPAMKLGSMIHKKVLEPDDFHKEYVVLEEKRTKEGKKLALEYEQKGLTTYTPADAKVIDDMTLAICQHPEAHALLDKGQSEQSFWWTHSSTGLDCKCRCDKIHNDTIVDLKTCGEGGASAKAFTSSIMKFMYHVQAAHYLQGTGADRFIFVAIEKVFPYNIGVYELNNDFIDLGYELQEKALFEISEANQSGIWKGYTDADGIQTLEPPHWAINND